MRVRNLQHDLPSCELAAGSRNVGSDDLVGVSRAQRRCQRVVTQFARADRQGLGPSFPLCVDLILQSSSGGQRQRHIRPSGLNRV